MPLHKFGSNDVYHNTVETYPSCSFFVYLGEVFYNNQTAISGAFINGRAGIGKTGHVSLYEMNIDRRNDIETPDGSIGSEGSDPHRVYDTGRIYPYAIKDNRKTSALRVASGRTYTDRYELGDVITGSYSMSASISRALIRTEAEINSSNSGITSTYTADSLSPTAHSNIIKNFITGSHRKALRTSLDFNSVLSSHYQYSASGDRSGVDNWDKDSQEVNIVSVPSIFYGSSIKKGSVSLKYFITGTLVGELRDVKYNGELVQVEPSQEGGSVGSGSVAGVVLYKEGIFVLTGSWLLANSGAAAVQFQDRYHDGRGSGTGTTLTNQTPSWLRFAQGANDGTPWSHNTSDKPNISSSYSIDFLGTSRIQTVSMMAHAKKGEANWSNNPTFITSSASSSYASPRAGAYTYFENELEIKNIVSSSFSDTTGSFERTTFISKVGVYDEDKNLIGVATLANPVKKTDERDLTFKLKLDI